MPGRREIVGEYNAAVQYSVDRDGEPPTPTQFMLESSPGENKVNYKGRTYYTSYKNADSARRAFTKLRTGETSGEKIYKRSENFTYLGKSGEGFHVGPPRGGYEKGLWKVVVHMEYEDEDGATRQVARSFIVRDTENRFTSQFSKRQLEYELGDEIENHMEFWAESGSTPRDMDIVYTEIFRIQTTSKTMNYQVFI